MVLKRPWPEVSHSCSFTRFPSSRIIVVLQSGGGRGYSLVEGGRSAGKRGVSIACRGQGPEVLRYVLNADSSLLGVYEDVHARVKGFLAKQSDLRSLLQKVRIHFCQ